MGKTIAEATRELCTAFPEVEEVESHGMPHFKVQGKTFANLAVNHHGDGRIALWLHAPKGAQEMYTQTNANCYFVPPYVGHKGWLGVELNKNVKWGSIAQHVHEAFQMTATSAVASLVLAPPKTEAPTVKMKAEDINPFLKQRASKVLKKLAILCSALPETSRVEQFGNPTWKAGKKSFISANYYSQRLALQFWVGAEQQSILTMDERFTIPAYTGHNGWINLDIEDHLNWAEIESLLIDSYKHFALKRMLKEYENPST
ncbi:MAG: MmcQ/YjbR family DNA-binding protein [Pseudomonadota bacterium]